MHLEECYDGRVNERKSLATQNTGIDARYGLSGSALAPQAPGDFRNVRRQLDLDILSEAKGDPVLRSAMEDQMSGE